MKFTLKDYVIMSILAAVGIASKAVIVPITQIITGALFIPAGVFAGGVYMSFMVLGKRIIPKTGTATTIALIQGIVVALSGTIGSHGALSILTYTLPGLAIDIVCFFIRKKEYGAITCFLAGALANLVGSYSVNLVIFNLPFIPLMLSLLTATLSGGLGGLLALGVARNLEKLGILQGKNKEKRKKKTSKNLIQIPEDKEDIK